MRLKNKRSSWLVTIPLLLTGAGYVYLFYLPASREIEKRQSELETKKQVVARSETLPALIDETERQIVATEEFVASRRERLTDEGKIAGVFGEVSRVVSETGNQQSRFDPQRPTTMASLKIQPLTLGANGRFRDLTAMLAGLEAMPATHWIESLHLQNPSAQGNLLQSEVNLEVFVEHSENSD